MIPGKMNYLNPQFELVKNEGRKNETVLCTSRNRLRLRELKAELIKLHNRNKYTVRPEVHHVNDNLPLKRYHNA